MSNILNFGKYSGKTIDYIIENDIEYCIWVLKNKNPSASMKHIQDKLRNKVDFNELVKNIIPNVSSLSNIIQLDQNYTNLTKGLTVTKISTKKNIHKYPCNIINNKLESLYGTFVDYLIRHMISSKLKTEFHDLRSFKIIMGIEILPNYYYYLQNIVNNNAFEKETDFSDDIKFMTKRTGQQDNTKLINKYTHLYEYLKEVTSEIDNIDTSCLKNIAIYFSFYYGMLKVNSDPNNFYYYNNVHDSIREICLEKHFNAKCKKNIKKIKKYILAQYYWLSIKKLSKEEMCPYTTFYKDIDFDKIYCLINSYHKCITHDKTIDILNDIYNTSIMHMIWFGRFEFLNHMNLWIDNENVPLKNIEKFIDRKMKKDLIVELNPVLGCNEVSIGADADLIVDKEIIDFKVSKNTLGLNLEDFNQLLIYSTLCRNYKKKQINKITIFNPLLNEEFSIDITNWNNDKKLYELLKSYKLGLIK